MRNDIYEESSVKYARATEILLTNIYKDSIKEKQKMSVIVDGFIVYELESGVITRDQTVLVDGWFLIYDTKTERKFWIQMVEGHINQIRNADEISLILRKAIFKP